MKIIPQWPFRLPFRIDRTATNQITYSLPDPAKFSKAFNHKTHFQPNSKGFPAVNWANWNGVIDEYEQRILVWYIHPVAEHVTNSFGKVNPAYPLMFTLCALIDLLTQYMHNLDWHSPKQYQHFVRTQFNEFNHSLSNPIEYTREIRGIWQQSKLKNRAEVFYVGFRCSLLHHGDLAAFCGITALQPDAAGNPTLLKVIPNAGTSIDGLHTYDLHLVDPSVLKDRVVGIVQKYCNDLRANPASRMATNFKRKFERDYGIKI